MAFKIGRDVRRTSQIIIALFFFEALSRCILLAIIPLELLAKLQTLQHVTWFYAAVAIFGLGNSLFVPLIFNKFGGRTVIALSGFLLVLAATSIATGSLAGIAFGVICRILGSACVEIPLTCSSVCRSGGGSPHDRPGDSLGFNAVDAGASAAAALRPRDGQLRWFGARSRIQPRLGFPIALKSLVPVDLGWRRSGVRILLHSNSLLTGNLTGNFRNLRLLAPRRRQVVAVSQGFPFKFPTQPNRELSSPNREFSRKNRDFIGRIEFIPLKF